MRPPPVNPAALSDWRAKSNGADMRRGNMVTLSGKSADGLAKGAMLWQVKRDSRNAGGKTG